MKISFDFDGTLARKRIRALAVSLQNRGHKISIVTSRNDDDMKNGNVYMAAAELGISPEEIIFTNGEPKYTHLQGMDIHFDNNPEEVAAISKHLPELTVMLINNYKSK
jgi:hypothetical protein